MSELLETEMVFQPKTKRWTTEQYCGLAETGVFDGQRFELIDGEICEMTPMNEGHADGVTDINYLLIDNLPRSLRVRAQMPLYIGEGNAPEPDIAVVDANTAHTRQRPTTAHLIIEVSDATLRYDQTTKMSLYASAQIPEYWILNVQNRTLETYRAPIEEASSRFGWTYSLKQIFTVRQNVAPLCAPEVVLQVGEFMP